MVKTCIEIEDSKILGDFLVVKKEDGSTVHFSDPDEAKEFMKLWFGMKDYEINEYWERALEKGTADWGKGKKLEKVI
jgi:hypothetical protein